MINATYGLARAAPLSLLENVAITMDGGSIGGVAPESGNGPRIFAMPALVNAHDHCRGLHHVAFGARDQNFEIWRAALYAQPPLDPYLNAALAFGRLAQAGVGTVMHVYSSIRTDRLLDDAAAIARAAEDVGIRLGFVVPLRDQQTLGYAPDAELIARHEGNDQALIRDTWLYPFPTPDDFMQLVDAVAATIEGPRVSVLYGPNSPQACSDDLLAAIGDASRRTGRGITTHLLETSIQRAWADARYPHGFIRHLVELGIVCPRFTAAHGVWLNADDIDLMAAHDAAVAINASSNLRLRSGTAPVPAFLKAGLRLCFGVDSFALDDDEDALKEMRFAHWLFSPHDTDRPLTVEALLEGWGSNGFRAVTGGRDYGALTVGARADVLTLDYDAMAYDVIDGMIDPLDLMLTRASARHVKSLHVDGREIVRDGRMLGIDLPAIERELIAQARAGGDDMRRLRPVLERSQRTLRDFYAAGDHTRS